jgi:hypothetical protein
MFKDCLPVSIFFLARTHFTQAEVQRTEKLRREPQTIALGDPARRGQDGCVAHTFASSFVRLRMGDALTDGCLCR